MARREALDEAAGSGRGGAPGPASRGMLRIDQAGAIVSGVGVMGMMLVGAADVVLTRFFNSPIPGAFELTEAMMVSSIFLAIAMAQRERKHIRVEILVERLPARGRAAFDLAAHALSAAVFALIAWYGWKAGLASASVGEFASGLIRFPVWPSKLALAVGATMMVAQSLIDVVEETKKIARG